MLDDMIKLINFDYLLDYRLICCKLYFIFLIYDILWFIKYKNISYDEKGRKGK